MRNKLRIGLAAAIFLCSLVAGNARAKELYSVDFTDRSKLVADNVTIRGEIQSTADGRKGWRDKDPSPQEKGAGETSRGIFLPTDNVLPSSPSGSLSFIVQYPADANPDAYNSLFRILDEKGNVLIAAYLAWKGDPILAGGATSIYLSGARYNESGAPVYGKDAVFGDALKKGSWVNLVFTWGPEPAKDNRIYLNGREAVEYRRTGATGKIQSLSDWISAGKKVSFATDTDRMDPFENALLYRVATFDAPIRLDPAFTAFSKIRSVRDDAFQKSRGISGKLVAGDQFNVWLEAEAGGKATIDVGSDNGFLLAEDPNAPGKYSGIYTVKPGMFLENVRVVGRFVSSGGVEALPVPSESGPLSIDSRNRFALSIDRTDLPADSSATSRVKVKVTDANDTPVKDRQIKVTLSTTDEYTGLVGGGATRSRNIAAANKDALAGAEVESRWKGVTDSWGEVEFDFRSGFAAKTVILQVKDMTSGDVGVDYITSYKEASIDIALTAPISRAAARRGLQYILKVEATRTELTADGRSRSVIRATLSDPNGAPVQGDPVTFSLSSPNGTLRTIQGTTDAGGVATAEYTAGKKIGIVVVTAVATLRNVTGNVSIILLADAPAKVYLKARPESLPADGVSRADLSVKVTDINDNPNKDTKVEFKVAKGGGKVEYADRTTDQFGDTANRYTAGTTPGIATVVATVRSRVPTDAELSKARNVIFVPYSPEGDEIKVARWLKRVGETALLGEPVVEYTVGRNPEVRALKAPFDCRIDFQYVEYWDTAQTGDTLAQISPVSVPGSPSPPPAPVNLAPRRR